jgi:hypothetical protein
MDMASSQSESQGQLDEASTRYFLNQVRNGFLSLVASSFIFLGPAPSIIDPAYAAAPTPSAQAGAVTTSPISSSSSKSKPTQSAKPIDPLLTEKANVEAAKEKYNVATAALTKAKKGLADANTEFSKAETSVKSAENKVASSKKALIAANDKLADAKAKEGANVRNLDAVEKLATKVGKESRQVPQ